MNYKKIFAWLTGGFCTAALLIGLMMLVPSETFTNVIAIVIICLNICFGILTPNPVSVYGLSSGIAMLVLPSYVVAFTLLFIGVAGAITNLAVWKKVTI